MSSEFQSSHQTVSGISLPYVGPISGGLKEGMALYLLGAVPTNADQFSINFKTGPSNENDVAFHFNPRMNQMVVLNSFTNEKWDTEESVSDNPFKTGEAFEMHIAIKSEGYQVYVNRKEHCTFKHRKPLEKVSVLNITGDVAVNFLCFIQNWSTSLLPTEVTEKKAISCGERSNVQSEIWHAVQNPSLPYVGPISGGLKEGMAMYLEGVVHTNADRFDINFKTGPYDQDIAFHFNPRMDEMVVLNSYTNGKWDAQESVSDNPFKKGEDFKMFIVIKSEGYQVHVKGKQHSMFKHRIPLEKVNTINIHGKVSISFLGFVTGM